MTRTITISTHLKKVVQQGRPPNSLQRGKLARRRTEPLQPHHSHLGKERKKARRRRQTSKPRRSSRPSPTPNPYPDPHATNPQQKRFDDVTTPLGFAWRLGVFKTRLWQRRTNQQHYREVVWESGVNCCSESYDSVSRGDSEDTFVILKTQTHANKRK